MLKKIFISLFVILTITSFSSASISKNSDSNNNINIDSNTKNVILNNVNNKSMNIKLKDISIFKEKIDIGEIYDFYAILTMNVENNGINDIELCNIDIYPYQGNKETKYFVKTSDENIKGFIGKVKKGECTDIKIGVVLYNENEEIKLDLVTNNNIFK